MEPLQKFETSLVLTTTDDVVRSNLLATKERVGTRWLDVRPVEDRTLVICGSGPSALKTLESFGDPSQFDIMALNGAYKALMDKDYLVKYYVQIDARPENRQFVKDIETSCEHFLAAQAHPDVFQELDEYGAVVTTFHLATESTREVFAGAIGTFLGGGCGTVGMTALPLAIVLGYRKIVLVGYDSSFAMGASHLLPQAMNDSQQRISVEFRGKWYHTTPILARQVMDFPKWFAQLNKDFPGVEFRIAGEGLFYDFLKDPDHVSFKTTREEELARYKKIYAEDPDYHCTDLRLDGLEQALELAYLKGCRSYLDVSCGRGESLHLGDALGFSPVYGTETVGILLNERTSHEILPYTTLESKSYDVVSLIEVIEHLVEDDVMPTLLELNRLARKCIIISAAVFPSWHNDANLHPSARPEKAWDEMFRSVWGDKVKRLPFDIHPSPAWMVTL